MSFTTDPATRQAFITGLRDLASYLDTNPGIPVPVHGTEIYMSATLVDHGGCAEVDRFARQTGVPVTDNTASSGHYTAVRSFGPVLYRMIALSAPRMTIYQDEATLNGFAPDTWT